MSKGNSFKSAQHSLNYQNLLVKRKNGKQPVKIFTEAERAQFATQIGMSVSAKPVSQPKVRKVTSPKVETKVDWAALPPALLKKFVSQKKG